MDYELFFAGFASAVVIGFLANRFGYLSVHRKIKRPAVVGVSTGTKAAGTKVQLH